MAVPARRVEDQKGRTPFTRRTPPRKDPVFTHSYPYGGFRGGRRSQEVKPRSRRSEGQMLFAPLACVTCSISRTRGTIACAAP